MNIADIEAYGEFAITVREETEYVWRGTFADMPETIKAKVMVECDDASDDASVEDVISEIIDNETLLSALVSDRLTNVDNQAFSLEEIV